MNKHKDKSTDLTKTPCIILMHGWGKRDSRTIPPVGLRAIDNVEGALPGVGLCRVAREVLLQMQVEECT